ncbi:ArsR family transcriptional regulator [Nocardia thailandica]|uniref:ArsR family transcriptional regulator n=1 Tax=Nocardia thailandica TaxID=257275 RepID=A0ABW6PLH5_9NOCA|nr:winged helix-turn-helix domain-containing protein [Nocardia thailandica]
MELAVRIAELERRVAALEGARAEQHPAPSGPGPWAVTGLREEFEAAGTPNGGVLMAGALRLPTGERLGWQARFGIDDLLRDDWTEAAKCLAALTSPIRLYLLREILAGRRTAADLAAIAELGTSAEIYQHLRELAAVGWLQTAGRGRFEVPEARVVPLLVALSSAQR